ncbi:MAG TPA: hypothetical protein V6D23_02015 [Candidatus Obscuribacterales bacterium]
MSDEPQDSGPEAKPQPEKPQALRPGLRQGLRNEPRKKTAEEKQQAKDEMINLWIGNMDQEKKEDSEP